MQLLAGLPALLGGGGAAAGAAGAAGAAAGGLSLAGVLQGTATVLGFLTAVGAGNAEADKLNAAAIDAQTEQSLENLQGIERKSSIKQAMVDALGAQDTAYAASGLDLSFGTAAQARKDAFREADRALTGNSATTQTRLARLSERASNYRSAAKQAKLTGWLKGTIGGLGGLQSMVERG